MISKFLIKKMILFVTLYFILNFINKDHLDQYDKIEMNIMETLQSYFLILFSVITFLMIFAAIYCIINHPLIFGDIMNYHNNVIINVVRDILIGIFVFNVVISVIGSIIIYCVNELFKIYQLKIVIFFIMVFVP